MLLLLPFSISNEIGFSSGLYPAGVSTSTNSYFPIDKSETFAFLSLSVLLSQLLFLLNHVLQIQHFLMELTIFIYFVISTFPVSTISFSTFNDRTSVMPF